MAGGRRSELFAMHRGVLQERGGNTDGHARWRGFLALLLLLLMSSAYPASALQCDPEDCPNPREPVHFTSGTSASRPPGEAESSPAIPLLPSVLPSDCPTTLEEQAILLINVERDRIGLPPLQLDIRLQAAARWFSNDIAVNGFQTDPHEDSEGHDPGYRITAQGYTWTSYGETLALGTGPYYTDPEDVVQGWMGSPPHKAILLGSFEHIGVGHTLISGSPDTNAWVADFGNTAGARSAPPGDCDPGFFSQYLPFVGKAN